MKRSITLILALAVLLGIYWLVQSRRPVVSAARPFVEYDSAAVNLMRVETATDTIELRKEGDLWNLVVPLKFPAAQNTVQQAISRLRDMEKLTLITKNTDRHSEFQVNDTLGVKVTIGQGNKRTVFYVGRTGPTGQTTYARMANANDVWEIGGNQATTFKRKAKDWRDKTITEFNGGDFRKITLHYPDQTLTLALEDTVWKVDAGREQFDGERDLVERLTNLLSRMSGVDFADTLAANAFDQPVFQLEAEFASGQTLDLKLIAKDAEATQYYLRKAGATADYVIYKSTANALMKKAEDFKSKAGDEEDLPAKAARSARVS
jgi:hypothetical protein